MAGKVVIPFLVIQAVYGASLLEVVNYVEHYGSAAASRRTAATNAARRSIRGTAITSSPTCSCTSCSGTPTITRIRRARQALRHFDDAPQLPAGYATMILFAYVPPLWYRVMNPRVVAHYGGNMAQSNIKPSIRARVLAQYPAAA